MFNLEEFHSNYRSRPRALVALWMLVSAIFFESGLPILTYSGKARLLRLFGARIGQGLVIKPSVKIKYPWLLSIGDFVWLGERVWIDNVAQVSIGNNVCISQGVAMETGNHDFKKKSFDLLLQPIVVEDNVWIGCFTVILPNSTVPQNCMVPAGVTFKNGGAVRRLG